MSPRTPQELEQINRLYETFIASIDDARVSRQVAVDALEFTFDVMRERHQAGRAPRAAAQDCGGK
jgi:uncharacterized protein (DUF2267 family)